MKTYAVLAATLLGAAAVGEAVRAPPSEAAGGVDVQVQSGGQQEPDEPDQPDGGLPEPDDPEPDPEPIDGGVDGSIDAAADASPTDGS